MRKEGLKVASKDFNTFWENVLKSWGEIQTHPTTAPIDVLSQPLWYKDNIKINNKHTFLPQWEKKRNFFINDLVKENGNFMSFNEFHRKYNLNTNFLNFNGILTAIPRNLKELIKNVPKETEIQHTNIQKLKKRAKSLQSFLSKISFVSY